MMAAQHSTGSLKNPWRAQVWGVWFATAATAALGLAAISFSEPAGITAFVLAGILGLIGLGGEYYVFRAYRHLAAFRRGEYLVCWTYTPAQWEGFLLSPNGEGLRSGVNRRLLPGVGAATLGCYGMVLFGWLGKRLWPNVPENDPKVFLVILFCSVGPFIGAAIGWSLGVLLRRTWGGREQSPQLAVAYIGRGALYLNGVLETWAAFGLYLSGVALKPGPPATVEFYLTDIDDNSRLAYVPVPDGREDEAERVVRELTGQA